MSLSLPIDTSKLTFIKADEIEPVEHDGQAKIDDNGRAVVKVPVIVRGASRTPEVIAIRVGHTSALDKLPDLGVVKVVGLTARPWEINGRSGITFAAESITAATA